VLLERGSFLVSIGIHLQRTLAQVPYPPLTLRRRVESLSVGIQFESVVLRRGTLLLGL
jgi:hypothetical protein